MRIRKLSGAHLKVFLQILLKSCSLLRPTGYNALDHDVFFFFIEKVKKPDKATYGGLRSWSIHFQTLPLLSFIFPMIIKYYGLLTIVNLVLVHFYPLPHLEIHRVLTVLVPIVSFLPAVLLGPHTATDDLTYISLISPCLSVTSDPSFISPFSNTPGSSRSPLSSETSHTGSRLRCYHPLSSDPWSLFRFQTPFSWSIGLPSAQDTEVVWTVVDSLFEGQLPDIPLIYLSLHWLMEREVTGQPFIVEGAWPENK